MAPIPVTILTGFLGSGKTTILLNLVPQLRARNPSYRLALLKNEFGDVAVDSQLASASAVSGVQELLNGCICCNLVGSLSQALAELRSGSSPGTNPSANSSSSPQSPPPPPPDRIVIETSGSAFPATLAMEVNRLARETAAAGEGGEAHYALDGVISVVDVENWRGYEDTSYTARLQARYTDLIVFNKWELCGERRFDDCLDRVGDLELDVPIPWVKSDRGRVPVDVVFGVDGGLLSSAAGEGGGRSSSLLLLTDREEEGEEKGEKDGHGHDHDHGDHGHGHSHDHQTEVEVLSVTLKGADKGATLGVNPTKLTALLKAAPKDEVYRIKAVLTASGPVRNSEETAQPSPSPPSSSNHNNRYILNWAFGRWTFTPLSRDPGGTDTGEEHESSKEAALRMTLILARYESAKWKEKLESSGWLELDDGSEEKGELSVVKIA